MRHITRMIIAIVIVLIIVTGAYAVMHVNISAVPEPGPFETMIATKAKDWYIGRAAHGSLPPAPPRTLPAFPRVKHYSVWGAPHATDRTDASRRPSASLCTQESWISAYLRCRRCPIENYSGSLRMVSG